MHDARLALDGLSWVCYACRSKDSENSLTAIYEQQHSTEWVKAWVNGLWDILLLLHTLVHFTWWFVLVICTWYFLNECSRVLFKICGVSLSVMPNDMFLEITTLRIWSGALLTSGWFLSSMCYKMSIEVPLFSKRSRTLLALESLLSSMPPGMVL